MNPAKKFPRVVLEETLSVFVATVGCRYDHGVLTPNLDTFRLFIHVLAAAVWVGGQVVLAGLVPTARTLGPDAPKNIARAFEKIAWPAFGIAFFTGMWNLFEIEGAAPAFHATLGLKITLFFVAGASALLHSRTPSRPLMAITGALGGILALVLLFLGVLLGTNG